MKIEGKHISATEGLPVVESRDGEKKEEGFIGTLKYVVSLNWDDKEKMQSREEERENEEKKQAKSKKKAARDRVGPAGQHVP